MEVAVALTPTNRFVVRSAARLYVHLEDAAHAHKILVKAASAHADPWLIAAELAVAPIAKVAPKFVFEARRFLKAGNYAPIHLSEMASALATLEMSNGNNKQARKLFYKALQEPTENTVAQVNWATEILGTIKMSPSVLEVPRLFEARSWGFYRAGQWRDALDQSFGWLEDQPFSSRPAIHGSYIASSLLEDYDSAERIARAGLEANPGEFGLLNNLTVALARTGRVTEAVRYFGMINRSNLSAVHRIVWHATAGLLCFRNGQIEQARALYGLAVDNAAGSEMESLRAQAALARAAEELYAQTPEASEAKQTAIILAEASASPVIKALVARISEIRPGGQ
jgi:tetratricopeptide (TPR) repeat protein